jgi:dephospho-CoA kinase
MPAIGITGGISTGKTSFVASLREVFRERPPQRGVPTRVTFFDADLAARELGDKDREVRGLIEKEFGPQVYSASGSLNRGAVRAIVFADADKKRALEQILHPRIRRQWSLEAEGHRNSTELFFADIPLLYETGGETLCDEVVVVACSPELQLERLLRRGASHGNDEASREVPARNASHSDAGGRPPLDAMTAQRIIDAQMPLTEKISCADHVVWNNGGREVLREQARLLVELWTNGRN